jgi:hypothetical protein
MLLLFYFIVLLLYDYFQMYGVYTCIWYMENKLMNEYV